VKKYLSISSSSPPLLLEESDEDFVLQELALELTVENFSCYLKEEEVFLDGKTST